MPTMRGDAMRGLAVFISDIRNCKSREAELRRINKELTNIRQRFRADKTLDGYQKKKYVCKLLFIFLLGHDIDFGYMEAVNLLSSNKYTEKQIGYLFISVIMNSSTEMKQLIIQNIRNDLQSRNPIFINLALQCVANIGDREMAVAFTNEIPRLLISGDTIDAVKQSAALCLLRLHRTSPDSLQLNTEWTARIIHLLNDQHLGVATAAVSLIDALVKRNPDEYKGCVALAVSRLSRIVTSSYTDFQDYTYYFVPAPWLCVKLLRLLQNYPPPDDPSIRSRLNECLDTILNKAQEPLKSKKVQHSNARNAVLFEAINLIIHMDCESSLLVRACNQLGQFLQHRETNLRYLALESMCLLAASEFSHEAVKKHQETVINALKSERDVSVRQRAVDLLYAMCDRSNAQDLVQEMLTYLETADYTIREEMVLKIAILSEKYAIDYKWYLDIMLKLIRIAMGDFNNDHVPDFVVANNGKDSIGILLGYKYNSFQDQQTYSNQFSLRPSSIISRDFNNDTYIDIATAFAGNNSVGILFGLGNGTFGELVMYSVGYNSYPYEIVAADVNNDNILDIVVANAGSNTLGVLLGFSNGTFAPVMTFSTGNNSEPYGAAAGDFNNDNHIDFVVANYHSDSIGVLLGFGNGSFGTVMQYSTVSGSRPQSVAVGDFNQDNITDIVVANYRRDNMGIFIGRGDGTFQNQVAYSAGYISMPTFIIVNDFNNDNQSDVAVSNSNIDNVGIFYGYGNGSFAPVAFYSTGGGSSPHYVRSGDFNNDKAMDICVCIPGTNNIMILYGLGDGRFILGPSYSTGTKSSPISMAVDDFNGDGELDITTANLLMDGIGVHISYGHVYFGGATTFSTGSGSTPYSIAVSDFNNDGNSDVVVANYGTNNIGIFLGHGNATFTNMMTYSTGHSSSPVAVTVGDLNLDNKSDIVVVNSNTNNLYFFLGLGNGTFYFVSIYSTGSGSLPYGATIGDFNNDLIPDIAAVAAGINIVLVLVGYGNGTFGNPTSYSMGYNDHPYAIAVADFTGNGWLDIAITNYDGNSIEILLKTC